MPNTIQSYVGDGATVLYSFAFEYISRDFVRVDVDKIDAAFTFHNAKTIRLISPAPAGTVVTIRRVTDADKMVEFVDGSLLLSDDLNLASVQALHVSEEARDNTWGVEESARDASASEARAEDAALRAAVDASRAEKFDGIWFNDDAAIQADTSLVYSSAQNANSVQAGDYLKTRKGMTYRVAASTASGTHLQTAGGVRLWEGGTTFSSRSRAAQAVARGQTVAGEILMVAGRRFEVNSIGPDGLVAIDFDFRGKMNDLISRMKAGNPVKFAAYGDSTTDGNGTSGWVANPTTEGGDAIGAAAHIVPNAWPAVLEGMLRSMFKNNGIAVWNAGYGGKNLIYGWARRNFAKAVIENPDYGRPDAVFLAWGLNDIVAQPFDVDLYKRELRYMLSILDFHGATPVLVTPDPASQPGPRQYSSVTQINAILRDVAEQHGLLLIDSADAIVDALGSPVTNGRWTYHQPDTLHGNNTWHRVRAGYLAAVLFPNTLWLGNDDGKAINIAPWGKEANSSHLSASIFTSANNAFGASMNVNLDSYALGETLLDIYVWNTTPKRRVWWHSVDNDGFYSRADTELPTVSHHAYTPNQSATVKSAKPNQAGGAAGRRSAETPVLVGELNTGLNRVRYNAPTAGSRPPIYLGYFSFRPAETEGRFSAFLPTTGTGMVVHDPDQYNSGALLGGFGGGRVLNVFMEATFPEGAGAVVLADRAFGGAGENHAVGNTRRGLLLFRGVGNVSLYQVIFSSTGVSLAGAALATSSFSWTDRSKFLLACSGDTSGNQVLRLYGAWDTSVTPLFTATIAGGSESMPWGGRPGPIFKNYGTPGGGLAVLDIPLMQTT